MAISCCGQSRRVHQLRNHAPVEAKHHCMMIQKRYCDLEACPAREDLIRLQAR